MVQLNISNLSAGYDNIDVLHSIDIKVSKGKVTALLGANGAGKSTIVRSILNLNQKTKGKIEFQGIDITRMETHDIVNLGINCIPEGRKVFRNMTVYENLIIGGILIKDKKKNY